jgi:hypothetical protein
MTYRGVRNVSLALANTLRVRAGQKDLQTRPRANWRDKNVSTRGTHNDQNQQRDYSSPFEFAMRRRIASRFHWTRWCQS